MMLNVKSRLALSFFITGMCVVAGLPAYAQVPSQVDPGLLVPAPTEQTREQQEQQEQKQIPTEEAAPRVEIDVPSQAPSVQIEAPRFRADKITIEGTTVLTQEELQPLVSPYEGQEVTLDDLSKIVDQLNQMYRDKGYLTTQAYVPPQEVNQGQVTIQVVEGTVGKVDVVNNRYYRLKAILRNTDLEPGELFNLKALEGNLNQSNAQNNFRLRAILSPGEQTGQTDIRLDVAERQPWQIAPTFDNQGRPFIGNYRGGVELSNDSLFGYGDRLATKFLGADGTKVGLGSYFVPLNGRGDELGISYGYSHVDVDTGTPDEIDGTAHSVGLLFSHPFDRNRTWVGDVGVNWRRVQSFFNDDRDSLDEIRSIQSGLNYNKYDSLGRTFARLQSTAGLDILGGNAQFWKAEALFTRLFKLPAQNILILRGYGQYTPDVLPSAEAFQVGGAYSVRGYTEGLIVGDRGYSFTVEDRWPVPFLGALCPWLADRLQGAVFFDIGQSWLDKDSPRFQGSGSERTLLASTGFGIRARLTRYLQGFMDIGFGLVDRNNLETAADPTARIHFGLRSNLLPDTIRSRAATETSMLSQQPTP